MSNEYTIINKTLIQKRIEELKEGLMLSAKGTVAQGILLGSIAQLEQILSQSTPLIPEIEKAFDAAREFDSIDGVVDINIVLNMPSHDLSDLQEKTTKQDYITNLKLDI